MRRGRIASWVVFVCALQAAPLFAQSTAFYYGTALPDELAKTYPQVVVQPEHVADPARVQRLGAQPFAYFSVGELAPSQAASVPARWILERNQAWASLVMNVADADYRAFTLERFEKLWGAGYRGFFLDTLDSYQLAAHDDAARAVQRQGLVALVRAIKAQHPEAKLLVNRGFELLPDVAQLVQGVVAESLFDRWDAGKQAYGPVPDADRAWLLARLREVQSRYRLPVTVIDYRPPRERDAARDTARKIAALGFEPWVCDGALREVGIGRLEILPRRVLLLTDKPAKDDGAIEHGPLDWLAPILEYLGYFGELRSVRSELPNSGLSGRYAGVITWFEGGSVPREYAAWMLEQVRAGVRFAVFGAPGIELGSAEARELGLAAASAPAAVGGGTILAHDGLIGFEAEPPAYPIAGGGLVLEGAGVQNHLLVADQAGHAALAIGTAAWGGFAASHVFAWRGLHGERAWVVDPFAFLSRALQLPVAPIPDVTTENGRRLALFAIDPDGLNERARLRGRPLTSAVLRGELEHSGLPHALPDGALASLQLPAAYAGQLPRGTTDAGATFASLTRVQAMAVLDANGLQIPAPIASDSAYVPASGEAYAFERVLDTLRFTDAPRRLKPIALHYHAYLASSPAGQESLRRIYAWLGTQELMPVRIADYAARVQAFRELVLARDLSGAFSLYGGDALRTVRLPSELGEPDLAASSGVAALRTAPQGRYLSFTASGPRKLVWAAAGRSGPRVVSANGAIAQLAVLGPAALSLELSGLVPVQLELAGLPPSARCSWRSPKRSLTLTSDAAGGLQVRLGERATGPVELRCGLEK